MGICLAGASPHRPAAAAGARGGGAAVVVHELQRQRRGGCAAPNGGALRSRRRRRRGGGGGGGAAAARGARMGVVLRAVGSNQGARRPAGVPGVAAGGEGAAVAVVVGGVLRLHRVGRRRIDRRRRRRVALPAGILHPMQAVSTSRAVPLRVEDHLLFARSTAYGDDVENGNPARARAPRVHGGAPPHRRHSPGARAAARSSRSPGPRAAAPPPHPHYCGALGSAQNLRFTLEDPRCADRSRRHDAELRARLGARRRRRQGNSPSTSGCR